MPEAAKYDDRTWEAVVREGYLASGVLLAISFEQRAREATTLDDALAYNKAAYKVKLLGRVVEGRMGGKSVRRGGGGEEEEHDRLP